MNKPISELEQEIGQKLNASCVGLVRTEWNQKIRQVLNKLVTDNYIGKYDLKFASITPDFTDCMYDFASYEYHYEEKFDKDLEISSYSRRNAILVAEIEWDDRFENNVQPDFEKLLVARADNRLLVFRTESEEKAKECFKFLNEIVDSYKWSQSDDRYIYAASLNNENGRFVTYSRPLTSK